MPGRGLAADRVEGWSDLKRDIKLENAWVFANEDALAGSIKAFLAFEKKLLEPIPKADRATTKLTEITGAAPAVIWGLWQRSATGWSQGFGVTE